MVSLSAVTRKRIYALAAAVGGLLAVYNVIDGEALKSVLAVVYALVGLLANANVPDDFDVVDGEVLADIEGEADRLTAGGE